jgi:hypothetical protein
MDSDGTQSNDHIRWHRTMPIVQMGDDQSMQSLPGNHWGG